MKTKITFLKKGALLSCLLIIFTFNTRLNSQIIYTDIIPDAIPSVTYPLDLNNDMITDFLIQFQSTKLMCIPQNSNAYAGDFVGGFHLAYALSQSNSICSSLTTWYDSNNPGTMYLGTSLGYWVGATNKYLALKLIVGANTYYGWVRLDILFSGGSFAVKDYAFESTPNTCVQAGQTTLGITKNTNKNSSSIFPNPFISSTTIQTTENLNNATLTIFNSYGQMVKQVNNISGQTISLLRDNLPSGLYFIHLTQNNKLITTTKIIITD